MSDLLSEPRITFNALAHREGVALSTVWRWALRGCKGHVLESFNVGGRKFTTEAAFQRWVAKLNEGKMVPSYLSRQRERQIREAERALDEIMGPGWSKRR